MVKIEKLSADAAVWFQRDGSRQRAFLHQLISVSELESLEVESGTVVYSIDEQEIVSRSAAPAQTAAVDTVVEAAQVQPVAETKPKIVYPKKRK